MSEVNRVFLSVDDQARAFVKSHESSRVFLVDHRTDVEFPEADQVAQGVECVCMAGMPVEEMSRSLYEIMQRGSAFLTVSSTRVSEGAAYAEAPDYYKGFLREFASVNRDLISHAGNSMEDCYTGIANMLANLEDVAEIPGVQSFYGQFPEVPAVIVGAGPSLDKNWHELLELQDKALIFCADACLRFLLDRGVEPHFVTSLERGALTAEFYDGIKHGDRTVQVTVPVVDPMMYRNWSGPKAMMYRPFSHLEWLGNDKGTLDTGRCCTTMALVLAQKMGCGPIILMGMDLAHSREGNSHFSKADFPEPLKQVLWVDANEGPPLPTSPTLDSFRVDFQRLIRGNTFNCTEGGATIKGTRVCALKDFQDLPELFCLRDEVFRLLEEPNNRVEFLETVRGEKIIEALLCIDRVQDQARAANIQTIEEGIALFDTWGHDPLVRQLIVHLVQPGFVGAVTCAYAGDDPVKAFGEFYAGVDVLLGRFRKLFEVQALGKAA